MDTHVVTAAVRIYDGEEEIGEAQMNVEVWSDRSVVGAGLTNIEFRDGRELPENEIVSVGFKSALEAVAFIAAHEPTWIKKDM